MAPVSTIEMEKSQGSETNIVRATQMHIKQN